VRPLATLDRWGRRLTPYAAVFLRLGVGWVFLRHGRMKLGMGVAGVAGFLHHLGFPLAPFWAVVLIGVETLGAACVVLGLFTRFWAACLAIDMILAISLAVLPSGRAPELEGLLLAGALALVALGDGPLSLGALLRGRRRAA
jgi:putative oxidoreductase